MSYKANLEQLSISPTGKVASATSADSATSANFVVNSTAISVITTSTVYTSSNFSGYNDIVILCNNTTGPITVTLPAANTVTGRVYHIKKLARSTGQPNNITSTITVNATSGQVERLASIQLAIIGEGTTLVSDGTNYFEI